MIETIAIVESDRELAPDYRLLTLEFDREIKARAGQFAMLKAHQSFEPLLRRALAVYRLHGPNKISFLYQVLGRGTQAISGVGSGGKIDALIPLGNSWPLCFDAGEPDSATEPAGGNLPERAIVVAGGIGSASLLMLCESLARARINTHVFFGAASSAAARGCGLEDFRSLELPLSVTTDDGSLGERGFVTAPLARHLSEAGGPGAVIYACGPWVMMRRVAELAAGSQTRCLVSLEAPMGCGFGVCVGCVVAVAETGPLGYDSYKRVCVDGSIFPAQSVRWEVSAMTH